MLAAFVALVQLVAVVHALHRSARERFVVGAIGGAVRLLLLFIVGGLGFVLALDGALDRPVARTSAAATTLLVSAIAGPFVSFAMLYLAYRRKKDAPAKDEARLRRPFSAWLPAAVLDAALTLINVLVAAISAPS